MLYQDEIPFLFAGAIIAHGNAWPSIWVWATEAIKGVQSPQSDYLSRKRALATNIHR
jgi:hypothetical protein